MRVQIVGLFSVCLLALGCGSNSSSGAGPSPCEADNPPAECTQACSTASPCPTGFYCGTDGTCTADCALGTSNCGDTQSCTDTGQCVPTADLPDAGATTGITECNDGIDNDGDGFIDGGDPECTGSADNDEGTFATGIPGDNIDAVKQDCFFDGNSGAGDDGCDLHVCCLLSPGDQSGCPADLKPQQYDPDNCEQTQQCKDTCGALTPIGCDCFGCCSVCNDAGCFDIIINPNLSPDCTAADADDPDICTTCTKSEGCGPVDECASLECQLCPGEELPEECMGVNECATGQMACTEPGDCGTSGFCSNGCCIAIID
jgi:hypothetical protein